MSKLDRYIAANVALGMLVVMAVVVGLDVVLAFIDELEDVGGNYQAWQAVQYVAMTLPRRIYEYIPIGVLIGCLVGLGALANSNELVVMRAAGLSISRIVWAAMKPTLVVVGITMALGEYVAPHTEQAAQSFRAIAQSGNQAINTKYGVWHREGQDFFHFNAIRSNGVLHGITRYRFNERQELLESSFAREAVYQGDHWQLKQVVLTRLTPQGSESVTIAQQRWETELTPELLTIIMVDPDDLSTSALYRYAHYLLQQGLTANEYLLAFWKKMLQPLTLGVLVLVASSFVFGSMRSVSMGSRVFSGVVVGLVFKYTQDLMGPASMVFGFAPVWAVLTPIFGCFLLGALLIRRAG